MAESREESARKFRGKGIHWTLPSPFSSRAFVRQWSAEETNERHDHPTVRVHNMLFFVCSASVLFYLQRLCFLFAAFLFCLQRFSFVCSVSLLFAAVPFFVCSGSSFLLAAAFFFVGSGFLFCWQRLSFLLAAAFFFVGSGFLFCWQRLSFLFAAFLFCLQRFFFVYSVSFLFAACPLWATVHKSRRKNHAFNRQCQILLISRPNNSNTKNIRSPELMKIRQTSHLINKHRPFPAKNLPQLNASHFTAK